MIMKNEIVVLFIMLLAASGFLYYENNQLSIKLAEMESKTDAQLFSITSAFDIFKKETNQSIISQNVYSNLLSSRLDSLNETLRSTIGRMANVETEIASAEQKINEINQALNTTRQEFSEIKKEISENQESLDARLEWLSTNSKIPNSISGFYGRAVNVCSDSDGLNMACVPFYAEKDLDFKYLSDYSDELYSIENMISRRGGDCEDFSIFIKAFLNSFKSSNDAKLYGWVDGIGNFSILSVSDGVWNYRNAEKREFGKSSEFTPYVICYTTIPMVEGHCVIALSKNKINNTNLQTLDDSLIFEPQNGKYLGEVGTNVVVCTNGDKDCVQKVGHIHIIISDEDLFNFYNGKWNSFKLFSSQLNDMELLVDTKINMLTDALSVS